MKIPKILPKKKPVPVKTTYSKTIYCPNCDTGNELNIPMGTMIGDYIENCKCKECGCLFKNYRYMKK